MSTNLRPPSPTALTRVVGLVLTLALVTVPAARGGDQPSAPPGTAPALRAQVEAQPYRIGDWAGFRPLGLTDLDILRLGDGPDADDLVLSQPGLVIAVSSSPSPAVGARDAFARRALAFVALVTDVEAESAGTVRRGGAEWHETVARGRSLSGREVVVFQSIRFGSPGTPYLRVVGTAPAELRNDVLARFRRVARSLTPR
ncbi:hypothetical protein [Deinococcus aestuarii]|uniref:hypothetical protein n=1 Tax=Deinococcus aestuarii TaxID=2774531 RepID=UPI001C0C6371|nr:hypothetical protein [Deinococcus aestuarii]